MANIPSLSSDSVIKFTKPATIADTQFGFLQAAFVINNVFNPTPENFLGGKITFTLTATSEGLFQSINIQNADQFSLKTCVFSLVENSVINPAVLDTKGGSTITVPASKTIQFNVPAVTEATDFSVQFGYFTLADPTSIAILNFQSAPTAVSIAATSIVSTVAHAITFPLPTTGKLQIFNEFTTLAITLTALTSTPIVLTVTDAPTITVTGNFPPTTPIFINTGKIQATADVVLPIPLASLGQQGFIKADAKLNFISAEAICYYNSNVQGTVKGKCPGYKLELDTQLEQWDFTSYQNVKFVKAHVDIDICKLAFDTTSKFDYTDGLVVDVANPFTSGDLDAVLPTGVSFGQLSADVTIKSLTTGIEGISSIQTASNHIIAPVTITKAESKPIGDSLKNIDSTKEVTLVFTGATLELSGPKSKEATINAQTIDYTVHSFIISSSKDLESFTLTWTDAAQVNTIRLNAKYSTKFMIGNGHTSQVSVVSVLFSGQIPGDHKVPFTPEGSYASSTPPFTDITQPTAVTFVLSKPFCVYHSKSTCGPQDGEAKEDIAIASDTILKAATSITFKGACSVNIAYLPFGRDFTIATYIFGTANDKLLLTATDAIVDQELLTLNAHVEIASAMKSAKIIAPPSSFGNVGLKDDELDVQTIILTIAAETQYDFFPKIKSDCTITFSCADPIDQLTFSTGTVDATLVKVYDGVATFEAPASLKFIFGLTPLDTLSITKDTTLEMKEGFFSAPINPTCAISLSGDNFKDGTKYFTVFGEGITELTTMFVSLSSIPESPTQLLSGAAFQYIGGNGYCIHAEEETPVECANLKSSQNGVDVSVLTPGYVLVIGECQCDLNSFTSSSGNPVDFDSDIYHFQPQSNIVISSNSRTLTLSSLTLINKITVGVELTATKFVCPLSCVPSTKDVTSEQATIVFPPSASSTSITDLEHVVSSSKITLLVDFDNSQLTGMNLAYDVKTQVYTVCNQQFSKLKIAPIVQSNQDQLTFAIDITGGAAAAQTVLATVKVNPATTTISLGSGFEIAQGDGILTGDFGEYLDDVIIAVTPDFHSTEPFTNTVSYFTKIAKLCIYVEKSQSTLLDNPTPTTSCEGVGEGFGAKSSTDKDLGMYLKTADQIVIGETMTLLASTIANKQTSFTIDSRYSKKTETDEFKVEFDNTKYQSITASYKGVTFITGEIPPPAQTLALQTASIEDLTCNPNTVLGFNSAVDSLVLFVDPKDTSTYDIIGEGKVDTTALGFAITGDTTTASVEFKPAKTNPLVQVCESSYGWPSTITATSISTPAGSPKLTQIDVNFVKSEGFDALTEKSVGLDITSGGTVKILDGFSAQTKNPFLFNVPSSVESFPINVQYPESIENKFVQGDKLDITESTWHPTKPSEPTKEPEGLAGWAIAVIVIVVVIVVAVVVVLVLNFTGVIHLCGNNDDAPSV